MVNYSRAILGLTFAQHVFDSWINGRQVAVLNHPSPPAGLKTYFALLGDSSNFLASQEYLKDKLRFSRVAGLVDLLESAALYGTLVASLLPISWGKPVSGLKAIWDYAGTFKLVQRHGELVHQLAFAVGLSAVSMITSVPASLYRTFVLEERHGFNKTTFKTWLLDLAKAQLLSALIGLPLIAALIKIIDYAGPSFVTYTMAFIVAIQVIMIPLYPYLIAPIFNKYKPLKDFQDKENYVEVQKRTEKLASRLGFPLGKVWVMDGSTRSSHSNAFFFGMPYLTKHIVLYDTLLDQNSPEEVEAVLAHELGHWKFNHSFMMLLIGQVNLLANLLLIRLTLFDPALYRSFSFTKERPIILGLLLSSSLLQPLDTLTSFTIHAISRRFEFQADKFAYDLSNNDNKYVENLKMALVRLGDKNKSVTDVDPLWSAYKHSHPTMPERIERLDELVQQESKKQ